MEYRITPAGSYSITATTGTTGSYSPQRALVDKLQQVDERISKTDSKIIASVGYTMRVERRLKWFCYTIIVLQLCWIVVLVVKL